MDFIIYTIENATELAVIIFYIIKLKTTDSVDFLKEEIEEPTEQFVLYAKLIEACFGGLVVFFTPCLGYLLKKYTKNGMGCTVFMLTLMAIFGAAKLGLTVWFGIEVDFF